MSPEMKFPSPNGEYVLRIYPWEPRMSLWVETPELFDVSTQQSLVCFTDPHWSLDSARWLSNVVVTMQLHKYPGDHTPPTFEVRLDCEKRTATINGATALDFPNLENTLERLYTSTRKA